jgi:hypothetical protein
VNGATVVPVTTIDSANRKWRVTVSSQGNVRCDINNRFDGKVNPRLTVKAVSATVVPSANSTLSGTVKTYAGAVKAVKVTVEAKTAAEKTWKKIGSATTSATGAWSLKVKPTVTKNYRVSVAATAKVNAGSKQIRVGVRPLVALSLNKSTINRGNSVVLTARSADPIIKSGKVRFERKVGNTWQAISTGSFSTGGVLKYTYKPKAAGNIVLRVVRVSDAKYVVSSSAYKTLKVK